MAKQKKDAAEESKRTLATARLYAEMAGHDPDEALKETSSAPPKAAAKPKTGAKRAKP